MNPHTFNLNDYQATSDTSRLLIELGNRHLKSTEQHSTINTLRKLEPDWLVGSILTNTHIILPNIRDHPIAVQHNTVKQLLMLPHKSLVTDTYTINIDPKELSYQKIIEAVPKPHKKPKETVAKPNKNMLEAFTRLRHREFRQKKLLKKRLSYYNRRRRTTEKLQGSQGNKNEAAE